MISWNEIFPWIPSKTTYFEDPITTPSGNSLLINCVFHGIKESYTFYVNAEVLIMLEKCSFVKCSKGSSNNGVVYLSLQKTGSFVGTKVIVDQCENIYSSGCIFDVEGSNDHFGTIKMYQFEMSNCDTKRGTNTNSINFQFLRGYQEAKDFNVTACSSQIDLVKFNNGINSVCARLLIESNFVGTRVFYMNYRGVLRKSNLINNTETTEGSDYRGLISTVNEGSFVVVEGCFIIGNKCTALSSTPSGSIIYTQCCIDSTTRSSNILIKNLITFERLSVSNVENTYVTYAGFRDISIMIVVFHLLTS